MCWLYSVPNFLVIQQLETLYLSRNNVRIVCKRVWRIDEVCAIKNFLLLELATDSRVVTHQNPTHVWSMKEVEGSGQLDHYRTERIVWPFCYLATGTCDLSQSQVTCQSTLFCKKKNFSHSFTYPTINTHISTKCRELPERILRNKP